MTSFDGSTGEPAYPTTAPEEKGDAGVQDYSPPVSALDLLRTEVLEREAEDEELFPVEIPGLNVRLMCSLDFSATDWEKWQRLSIPKEKRRRPVATDIQQGVLATLVLTHTCQHLEYRGPEGTWAPITGNDGEPLALDSDEMLRKFNQMTARAMVEKLFKRDAWLLNAGQSVVNASGYGGPEGEAMAAEGADENPTG